MRSSSAAPSSRSCRSRTARRSSPKRSSRYWRGTANERPEAAAGLVDEPRDDVAVASADLHLSAGIEHQKAFAIGVRLDLPDQIEVDDRRPVDPLEAPRVEALLEVL